MTAPTFFNPVYGGGFKTYGTLKNWDQNVADAGVVGGNTCSNIQAALAKSIKKAEARKKAKMELLMTPIATTQTDFSLPACSCPTPPWDHCEHTRVFQPFTLQFISCSPKAKPKVPDKPKQPDGRYRHQMKPDLEPA